MACEHDDCMTCPYPDCISKTGPKNRVKKKPGRKKMDPEEVRKHRLAYQRRYYQEHKEKYKAYMLDYYKEHKQEYLERERKRRHKKNGR